MAWKDLSIAQRSQLMNIYRRAGITDLYRMKEMYDASSPSFPDGGNQMRIGNPYGNLYEEGGQEEEKKGKVKLAKLVLAVDKYDPVTGTHYTVDSNGNVTPYQLPKSKGEVIGDMKESEMWNSQTGYLKIPLYGFQSGQDNTFNKYFKGFPYSAPYVYGDRTVAGIEDVTDWVRDGYYMFYNKEDATAGGWKYYKDADGHIIRINDWSNINDAGLTPIEYSEVIKMLPKREYIGGKDYRFKTMQRIPGFVDYVTKRANAYGVDPNLILHRIGKEGWIDQIVQQYNSLNTNQQNDSFWSGLWDLPVGGFGSFGLDDAGSNLMSGKYTLLDPNATWEETEAMNEKGRIVHSIHTENLKSALEIKAAEMAYRQREAAKKYGKSGRDLNIWTNAAFNMGLNHPKLADDDYIRRNYSYPDYLGASLQKKFGGILHAFDGGKDIQYYAKGGNICIKPENRGKFTALKKRTGHSASWFKEHGTPAQKKMAVFALNAKKWKHDDGGDLDGEEVYYDTITPAVKTAYLPSLDSQKGKAIARNLASRVANGSMKITDVPASYRGYVSGEIAGMNVARERDKFASEWIAPAVMGMAAGPAGAIAGMAGKAVDIGVNATTKGEKNSWGDLFFDAEEHPILHTLMEFTNPGYFVAGPLSKGMQNELVSLREMPQSSVQQVARPVETPAPVSQVQRVVAQQAPYEISDLGGGYMLKFLMRGNPLEKQISKNGTVNVNNVRALVGKGSKVEQAVVDKVLSSEEFAGKKAVDYNKFRKAVQDELITYERTPDKRWEDYGISRLGLKDSEDLSHLHNIENFAKSDRFDVVGTDTIGQARLWMDKTTGDILNWDGITQRYLSEHDVLNSGPGKHTYTFSSSRIPNGSSKHYDENTLGHSRTYTTADEPGVLHVMESQSDWAQEGIKEYANVEKRAGQLQRRIEHLTQNIADEEQRFGTRKRIDGSTIENDWELDQLKEIIQRDRETLNDAQRELDRLYNQSQRNQEHYLVDNYPSRQIQENLRYAAEKGQTKMRYPTRETAAKIEGYPEREMYINEAGEDVTKQRVYTYGEQEDKEIEHLLTEREKLRNKIYRRQEEDYTRGRSQNSATEASVNEELRSNLDFIEIEQSLKSLRAGGQHLKPGITRKVIYDNENILKRYTDFPKQFKKLFKDADVRTVTDAKGNTWYEVDVPEGYLQQEWAYSRGGQLGTPTFEGINYLLQSK